VHPKDEWYNAMPLDSNIKPHARPHVGMRICIKKLLNLHKMRQMKRFFGAAMKERKEFVTLCCGRQGPIGWYVCVRVRLRAYVGSTRTREHT